MSEFSSILFGLKVFFVLYPLNPSSVTMVGFSVCVYISYKYKQSRKHTAVLYAHVCITLLQRNSARYEHTRKKNFNNNHLYTYFNMRMK